MTWIRTNHDAAVAQAVQAAMRAYPSEYGAASREKRNVHERAQRDSIVMAHSLIPDALAGIFSGYGAMLHPDLPLSRAQQEMIAVVVSVINDCFY